MAGGEEKVEDECAGPECGVRGGERSGGDKDQTSDGKERRDNGEDHGLGCRVGRKLGGPRGWGWEEVGHEVESKTHCALDGEERGARGCGCARRHCFKSSIHSQVFHRRLESSQGGC